MAGSMYESQDLYLDPSIKYWVLFPIMIVMFLVGILRHNITSLLSVNSNMGLLDVKESLAVKYGRLFIANRNYLPESTFKMRKNFWIDAYNGGKYLKDPNATANGGDMLDPANMESTMSGMKQGFANLIPQYVLMSWVSYFFAGFVIIKLPFYLPLRFKDMLQRGIDTQNLDISWVSSLSWYFLNLFGLGGIFSLILGKNNSAGSAKDIAPQMQMAPNQKDRFNKMHKSLAEEVKLAEHSWFLEDIEDKILIKYGKKKETDKKNN
ncbi:transmembrane protein [Neocallimastix lanati (nom. inval.)]|jgi:hypothetical protein|uniref:ER membrane protein complex subunit 3 n=1 Tax=Neocallimastix californiae TaxID=1754190 RepID=A0A1Y2EPI1_9FUNG|nr:transmembrane protein [Neocallimastix sp. JGI-2020a]ORY73500.1 transmembrane protein [Neocallimastix californiae]|eukprot:ORY73500.1 transmembrane protein [Neocallimastix californiae]